jgi:hypothetical protein
VVTEANRDHLDPLVTSASAHLPPERGWARLEFRDPETQGRRAWGRISEDEFLIMTDDGFVYALVWPYLALGGGARAAEDYLDVLRKYPVPPPYITGAKSDAGPSADEYLISRLLSKPPRPEVRARIMRWLFCSNLLGWLKGGRGF